MTTIHDVARRAGVSIATVSNVINANAKASAETAERVKQAILDLNYIPNTIAASLKMNTTRIVGVLAEDISSFASPYIIDGICKQAEALGYHINVDNLRVNTKVESEHDDMYSRLADTGEFHDSVREAVNMLLSARVCGLIYIGVHPRDVSGLLPPLDIPVVYTYCYASAPASPRAHSISYDDYQGAHLAASHIIEAGHKKIAIMGGMSNSYATHRRMLGCQAALEEHSLPLNPDYVISGNWTYESGYNLTSKLFALPTPPTAVFVMNDLMAFGMIDALKEKGIGIPGDVSIHGFDDLLAARFFSPPLTTVALPLHEIGETAAVSIIKMTESDKELPDDELTLIPCSHMKRTSVISPAG